ncbi:MAG TPA: dual specificity protein phosphatase 23 [Candidatus Avalokitesvara rifleensis]|uniref:dual specificity protein phosphatase 23 n=1 Tax=Candidatus Avalokitesvara rifleensis TaxID=3367620 RepID=UPI002713F069|nr:dual specificity protein phosphatase 23 [Candidatus Brocadiales bacterium]
MSRNFSWLVPDEIAGMARPASKVSDFEFLKERDIDAIVSLTESPLSNTLIEEFGFEYKHVPVEDLTAPTLEQIDEFVEFAVRMKKMGKKVAVHCEAGIGRTGTMLACYLVHGGYSARDAVNEVRKKRPGSIETVEQEEIIARYAEKLAG